MLTPIQITNLILYVSIFVSALVMISKNHRRKFYAVPSLLFSIHGLIFYLAYALRSLGSIIIPSEIMMIWSSGFRLHGAFTVFSMSLAIIFSNSIFKMRIK